MPEQDINRLQSIWDACDAQRRKRADARRTPPLVRLWDGNWELQGIVHGELNGKFTWKLNDTGDGVIQLPVHHWLAKWVLDVEGRTKNVHITVDKDGARWGGRMRRMKLRKEDNGQRFVELQFLHDYEELKRIQIWSNPFLPAAVQFPRASVMAGPSAWTLKTMLMMNLVRLNASLWHLPNDPLDIKSWGGSRFDMDRWGIVVKPGSIAQDSSPWTIVSSRFKFWHDMAESTLGDAQLMVECRRYLDGDPEPWPGANLRNGALVIDIVDKSGHWSNDGHGSRGNIFTGILRSITRLGDNLVDESQVFIDEPTEVEEYQRPGFLGTNQKQPYVTYRDGAITGVEAAEFTWEPTQAIQVNGGGHSMPGVNEGISAAVQLAGNNLGMFIFQPTAGTIADTILRPIYSDTILAWMSLKSPLRAMESGWSHYHEHFARGSDRAYTLSGLVAMREGFWETRERTAHSLQIADGAPWFVGENGQGHFFLGDRISSTVVGLPDGKLIVEQVGELTFEWSRSRMGWEVTLGDTRASESPLSRAIREVSSLVTAVRDLGVV